MDTIQVSNYQGFTEEFLKKYLLDGMGVMSKREIDILIMNLLLKYGDLSTRSNYDLSIMLRIPETSVKRLRYEAKLRYPPEEEYIRREFLKVLVNAKIELDRNDENEIENMKIVFIMEDNYVRYAIQGRFKERGMFADSSFNSEIIKISCGSLRAVISEFYGEESAQDFMKRCKALKKTTDKHEFRKQLVDFALDTAKTFLTGTAIGVFKASIGVT